MRARFYPLTERTPDEQDALYNKGASAFADLLKALPEDPPEYLIPFWRDKLAELENDLLPSPRADLLNNKVIRWTMFAPWSTYTPVEFGYVRNRLGDRRTKALIHESRAGQPPTFAVGDYLSSGNIVHHAYHIVRHDEMAKPGPIHTVVEWGAGFGSMARLWKRMDRKTTYVCVDTALFVAIEWLYLGSIYGGQALNIVDGGGIKEGAINLVPLGAVGALDMQADLFLSTWAVSESAKAAQDLLIKKNLYGAKHVLIGHQGTSKTFPFAGSVRELVKGKCYAEDIKHLPGNSYLFK